MDPSVVSRIAHETYRHSPAILPEEEWWNNLESNFYKRPEGFELDPWHQFLVSSTAASDILLRTGGASMIGALALPLGFNPVTLKHAFDDRHIYESLADTGDPTKFFAEPPKGIKVKQSPPRWPHFKPKDGVCKALSFESPFQPINPRLKKAFAPGKENMFARARYWRHNDGPRPTICAIHGFCADPHWLNQWFFALPWFYKMGYDVMLFSLPFHGRRQSRFSPFSGHGFFAGGLSGINEAFAQAVFDFRIFMNFLEDEMGVKKIGVTGVSLGGYTTAILASVEKRLQFAIPNVPVVSLADLALEWFPINTVIKTMLLTRGNSVKELRHMLAVHCSLSYRPVIPRERLMIIGGIGDRLAPPKQSRLLWDHWGRCRIHWFPGSHVLHWDKGQYLKETAKFLSEIGFDEGIS